MTTPDDVARDAVEEWLEDGMEFCYIHERDDTFAFSRSQLEEARTIADGMIHSLLDRFRKEDM